MEYGPMSERILQSIEQIIEDDIYLIDFSLIHTDDNTKNKSPVIHQNHHLGLETWCTKYVYEYVCSRLFKVRRSLMRGKMNHVEKRELNRLIAGALFINPDVSTFWNMKRELVVTNVVFSYEEFKFSKLVLTRKPKSNEAFSYRRWLIDRFLNKLSKIGVSPNISVLETELSTCTITAGMTPNNYHSWNHRQWFVLKLENHFPDLISQELSFSEQWISKHVSENTGYHYRQFLIERVKEKGCNVLLEDQYRKVLVQLNILGDGERVQMLNYLLGQPDKSCCLDNLEMVMNYIILLLHEILVVIETIDKVYVEHESLWLHRRFVLQKLLEVSTKYLGENIMKPKIPECVTKANIIQSLSEDDYSKKEPKIFKSQPSRFQSTNLYRIISESEKGFLSKNSSGSAVQTDLANRHQKWVKYILGFETSA
ncbi:protein prenyltransferase alpha subunit repeat-containing protein 1 [Anthonomus grandis grandis]|uniref:protein prenyltransferase alpha subunit repeat-containing protein 1 n=1 Tax=Anthonomus grandis grandis TaxID=2921223 RepID=UPI002165771A|nr:protein prenyltransferase alpha subunit repeat-containing protein 1 [Anthonomus grandis grandis]